MKDIATGTLRKWKRDALETAWAAECKEVISPSQVKLLARRLTELIDLRMIERADFQSAVTKTTEKKLSHSIRED